MCAQRNGKRNHCIDAADGEQESAQRKGGDKVGVETARRFNTDLITAFAAGALLLAVTGIYAVVAFSVSLRDRKSVV